MHFLCVFGLHKWFVVQPGNTRVCRRCGKLQERYYCAQGLEEWQDVVKKRRRG